MSGKVFLDTVANITFTKNKEKELKISRIQQIRSQEANFSKQLAKENRDKNMEIQKSQDQEIKFKEYQEKLKQINELMSQKQSQIQNIGKAQKQAEFQQELKIIQQNIEKETELRRKKNEKLRGEEALQWNLQEQYRLHGKQQEHIQKKMQILNEESEKAHNQAKSYREWAEKNKSSMDYSSNYEQYDKTLQKNLQSKKNIDYSKTSMHNPIIVKHDYEEQENAMDNANRKYEQSMKEQQQLKLKKAQLELNQEKRGAKAIEKQKSQKEMESFNKEFENISTVEKINNLSQKRSQNYVNQSKIKTSQEDVENAFEKQFMTTKSNRSLSRDEIKKKDIIEEGKKYGKKIMEENKKKLQKKESQQVVQQIPQKIPKQQQQQKVDDFNKSKKEEMNENIDSEQEQQEDEIQDLNISSESDNSIQQFKKETIIQQDEKKNDKINYVNYLMDEVQYKQDVVIKQEKNQRMVDKVLNYSIKNKGELQKVTNEFLNQHQYDQSVDKYGNNEGSSKLTSKHKHVSFVKEDDDCNKNFYSTQRQNFLLQEENEEIQKSDKKPSLQDKILSNPILSQNNSKINASSLVNRFLQQNDDDDEEEDNYDLKQQQYMNQYDMKIQEIYGNKYEESDEDQNDFQNKNNNAYMTFNKNKSPAKNNLVKETQQIIKQNRQFLRKNSSSSSENEMQQCYNLAQRQLSEDKINDQQSYNKPERQLSEEKINSQQFYNKPKLSEEKINNQVESQKELTLAEMFQLKKAQMVKKMDNQQQDKKKSSEYVPRSKEEILAIRRQQMKRPGSAAPKIEQKLSQEEEKKSQLMNRLIHGQKAKVDVNEIKKLTTKNYNKLPEIIKKQEEQQKLEQMKIRQQNMKQFGETLRQNMKSK